MHTKPGSNGAPPRPMLPPPPPLPPHADTGAGVPGASTPAPSAIVQEFRGLYEALSTYKVPFVPSKEFMRIVATALQLRLLNRGDGSTQHPMKRQRVSNSAHPSFAGSSTPRELLSEYGNILRQIWNGGAPRYGCPAAEVGALMQCIDMAKTTASEE